MKLQATFRGADRPFEGDLMLELRGLPADARIQSARATIRPARGSDQVMPFQEVVPLSGGTPPFGVTVDRAPGGAWAAADFHARRSVAAAGVSATDKARVQIDMGGLWVPIHNDGTIAAPPDPSRLDFDVQSNAIAVPGALTARLKILPAGTTTRVDLLSVTWRSVPSGVSLRIGDQGPFWVHTGDLVDEATTADFAVPLRAYLPSAAAENGHAVVPFTLHSDTLARLEIEIELDYLRQQSLLPAGTREVALPFSYEPLPRAAPGLLAAALPAGAQAVGGATTLAVRGTFDAGRIVLGPTEPVATAAVVRVTAGASYAQPFQLPADVVARGEELPATAIDLLVEALAPDAALAVTVLADADGKPWGDPLLPEPVTVPLRATTPTAPSWTSAPLPAEFRFQPRDPSGRPRHYWLVVNALRGEANWAIRPGEPGALGLYRSVDGGLSWQVAALPLMPGALAGLFRLRAVPPEFTVPIVLQVGAGDQTQRVPLDRLQPAGRVDATLDFPEIAAAFDRYLAAAAPPTCPSGELLTNGGFDAWLAIGNDVGRPRGISVGAQSRAVAFSPNGAVAYVAAGMREIALVSIEVGCGTQSGTSDLGSGTPRGLVISPDGTRAYLLVTGFRGIDGIAVVDTAALAAVGTGVPLASATQALALSSDGARLYVGEADSEPDGGVTAARVRVLDTAALEQAALGALPPAQASLTTIALGTDEPTAIVVARTGPAAGIAWVLTRVVNAAGEATGRISLIDTTTNMLVPGPSIDLPADPRDIALTPEGKTALVLTASALTAVDVASRQVTGDLTSLTDKQPVSLAVSPDGSRAWVTSAAPGTLTAVDLAGRTASDVWRDDHATPSALAVAPQGDWVYLTDQAGARMVALPVGISVPDEWTLTSGSIRLACLPDPLGPVAVLLGATGDPPTSVDGGLSQVVPAAGRCRYELSFRGIASAPGAVAEVLWLGPQCDLLRADQVPIAVIERPVIGVIPSAISIPTISVRRELLPHRASLTAPEGAAQAEVRLSVPAGGGAVIDMVSFQARDELLADGDLVELAQGVPSGWTVEPAAASALTTSTTERGVVLRATGGAVTLTQTVPVAAGQPYALTFQGRVVAQATLDAPRVLLIGAGLKPAPTDDGSPAAAPTAQPLDRDGFDRYLVEGRVPAGAARVAVQLTLPRGSALEVSALSLRQVPTTPVAVTFLSQSPGQLAVSQATVTYDVIAPPPPGVPPSGLCVPTLPGRRPGTQPEDCCFCPCCGAERMVGAPVTGITPAGRPALIGTCPTCGCVLVRPGGRLIAGAVPVAAPRRVVRSVPSVGLIPTQPPIVIRPAEPGRTVSLTEVRGVGPVRLRQLTAAGIDSIERLATATPEEVRRALPGVSAEMAARMIADARRLAGLG